MILGNVRFDLPQSTHPAAAIRRRRALVGRVRGCYVLSSKDYEMTDYLALAEFGNVFEMEKAIRTLVAERDALKADAKRYRWLRVQSNSDDIGISDCRYGRWAFELNEDELDKIVDAAMAKETP